MEVNVGEWRLYREGYWSLAEVSGKTGLTHFRKKGTFGEVWDTSRKRDIVRDTSAKKNMRNRGIFR